LIHASGIIAHHVAATRRDRAGRLHEHAAARFGRLAAAVVPPPDVVVVVLAARARAGARAGTAAGTAAAATATAATTTTELARPVLAGEHAPNGLEFGDGCRLVPAAAHALFEASQGAFHAIGPVEELPNCRASLLDILEAAGA
jgi:hypothetical protein